MRCPYCAEEVRDDAVVCRYCGREFTLLETILKVERETVNSLENEITSLRRDLAIAQDAKTAEKSFAKKYAAEAHKRTWQIVFAVFLTILVPTAANLAGHAIDYYELAPPAQKRITPTILGFNFVSTCISTLAWFFPLLTGLWVSFAWPINYRKGKTNHAVEYALLGLLAALLQVFLYMESIRYLRMSLPPSPSPFIGEFGYQWRFDESALYIAYLFSPLLLFLSGGLLGDSMKLKEFVPARWLSGVPLWLADKVGTVFSRFSREPAKTRLVGFIRWFGSLLPGIIGFTGAIIPVVFYLITGE